MENRKKKTKQQIYGKKYESFGALFKFNSHDMYTSTNTWRIILDKWRFYGSKVSLKRNGMEWNE